MYCLYCENVLGFFKLNYSFVSFSAECRYVKVIVAQNKLQSLNPIYRNPEVLLISKRYGIAQINEIILVMWVRRMSLDPAGVSGVMCQGRSGQGRAGRSAASAVPVWDTEDCGSVPVPVTSLQEHSESNTNVEPCKIWSPWVIRLSQSLSRQVFEDCCEIKLLQIPQI